MNGIPINFMGEYPGKIFSDLKQKQRNSGKVLPWLRLAFMPPDPQEKTDSSKRSRIRGINKKAVKKTIRKEKGN